MKADKHAAFSSVAGLPTDIGFLLMILAIMCVIIKSTTMIRKGHRQGLLQTLFYDWFPQIDFAIGAFAAGLILFILQRFSAVPALFLFLDSASGTAAYGAALSAFAALVGFAVTVLAIVCAVVPSLRFTLFVSDQQYVKFWNAFTLTIRTLGVCAIVSLIALFLNKSDHFRLWVFSVFLLAVSITIPGVIRAALTLEVLVAGIREGALAKKHSRRKNVPV